MGLHTANQQNSTTSSKTSPSPDTAIEKAEGPALDRGSLFAKAAQKQESQRFYSDEGVSAAEARHRGHVADTAGLTRDGKQGGTATFGHDSAAIRAQTKVMLETLLPDLQSAASEGHKIVLDGHASTVGNDAYNQRLSLRRAEAIRDYLVKAGVPEGQIEIRAHGEGSPAVKENMARDQALNRRVEISIERKAAPEPERAPAPVPPTPSAGTPAAAPAPAPEVPSAGTPAAAPAPAPEVPSLETPAATPVVPAPQPPFMREEALDIFGFPGLGGVVQPSYIDSTQPQLVPAESPASFVPSSLWEPTGVVALPNPSERVDLFQGYFVPSVPLMNTAEPEPKPVQAEPAPPADASADSDTSFLFGPEKIRFLD